MPKTKEIFIHNKSELPIDGWFQLCYYCNTITARTVLFHMFIIKKYYTNFMCIHVHLVLKNSKEIRIYI